MHLGTMRTCPKETAKRTEMANMKQILIKIVQQRKMNVNVNHTKMTFVEQTDLMNVNNRDS